MNVFADPTFHAGECHVQRRAGTREESMDVGRLVFRDLMPDQHRDFFRKLPFIVGGAVDAQGQPWATLLVGAPGFLSTPTPQRLDIAALPAADDPLANLLQTGSSLGLLGIELATRRRNRLNGVIASASAAGIAVTARQSFGNCPKYIQSRVLDRMALSPVAGAVVVGETLNDTARAIVAAADTFFIATAYPVLDAATPSHGVDVSHRGGRPGFIDIAADGTLTVPDYAGNGFFNTLGNLQVHPRAGLLFVDFAQGHLLHVAVDTELIWDGPELLAVQGAERLLRMRLRRYVLRERALDVQAGPAQLSPHLPNPDYWTKA